MEAEIQALTEAVLKISETPWYNSALLTSIVGSLVGVFVGAWIASKSFDRQEYLKAEKLKIAIANKWMLQVIKALNSLTSFKQIYADDIRILTDSGDPVARTFFKPRIIHNIESLELDVYELMFLQTNSNAEQKGDIKWNELGNIMILIKNYNALGTLWSKRYSIFERKFTEVGEQLDIGHFQQTEPENFKSLIMLCEQAIFRTDEVIFAMHDFLVNFPTLAKNNIDPKSLKNFGDVISLDNNQKEDYVRTIEILPGIDRNKLKQLISCSDQDLELHFKPMFGND